MTAEMPYEWGHPQFDPETHRQWEEFRLREPYVIEHGLVFLPPRNSTRKVEP